jgi:hypothetical protein
MAAGGLAAAADVAGQLEVRATMLGMAIRAFGLRMLVKREDRLTRMAALATGRPDWREG